jgi:AcrR family transcriptional regulator
MPQLTRFERRKRATRQRLEQAAADLLIERGCDGVSVQAITDRADVGRGTFYLHFKDKDDILWAILREQIDTLHTQIAQEVRADQPVEQRVYRIWLKTFQHIRDHHDLISRVLGERGHMQIANRFMDYFAALMIDDLTTHMHKIPINLPAPFVANYLLGAQMRLIVWWIAQGMDYTPQQMADMFYQMTTQSPPPR